MEVKNLGGVPTAEPQNVIRLVEKNFKKMLDDPTLLNLKMKPTTLAEKLRFIREWEKSRLQEFELWNASLSGEDDGGFKTAKNFMKQITAFPMSLNTPYSIGFSYDGLILVYYHRLLKRDLFEERWNLGRGAGFCCQMVV